MLKATSEGTHRYSAAHLDAGFPPNAYRVLGRTGLKTSGLGFGTYRVSAEEPDHRAALVAAIRGGCNLIDTSTNYTDGSSETCVGEVIKRLIDEKDIERDQIIVVSKVGYVQGNNLREAQKREADKKPYPDMVKYAEGCWHCIHPSFIADQISESLKRLQLEKIDVYLLHNPEYFLRQAQHTQLELSLDKVRDLYYDRIRRAFRKLEDEVQAGRIGCYGVSSNTFGENVHQPEHTSLESLWEIACAVSKDRKGSPYEHHFSVVQMPANLLEVGPILTPNCEESKTVLEYAEAKEIGVLINRPLNAIRGNELVRLADMKVIPGETSLEDQLNIIAELEARFVREIGSQFDTGEKGPAADSLFAWGRELSQAKLAEIGIDQWRQVEFKVIRPQVTRLCAALDEQLQGDLVKIWAAWKKSYLPELMTLLEVVGNELSQHGRAELEILKKTMNKILPPAISKESFSRKALAILLNTPGIHCVLNGMRTVSHVGDSMGAMRFKKFKISKKDFEKLSKD